MRYCERRKKREWIISINHPFLTIWKWKYGEVGLDDITCLEIINDPTYTDARESNDQAIRYLDFLWEDGHRIWGSEEVIPIISSRNATKARTNLPLQAIRGRMFFVRL